MKESVGLYQYPTAKNQEATKRNFYNSIISAVDIGIIGHANKAIGYGSCGLLSTLIITNCREVGVISSFYFKKLAVKSLFLLTIVILGLANGLSNVRKFKMSEKEG